MDETTDGSCTEQESICIRYVTQNLNVHVRNLQRVYETTATNASTMFEIAQDVVTRLELQLLNYRGRCYALAATMYGKLAGLQKRICDIQPKALFVHCMNHSLNLAFQDYVSSVQQCPDVINQISELINFVREYPKRLAWFASFQQQDTENLRPLCPTRWTIRLCSIKSVLDNYTQLLSFLEEVLQTKRGEAGSKSSGCAKQLSTLSMYFSLKLLYMVFSQSEVLAHSLQPPKLSLVKAARMIDSLSCIWNSLRNDISFSYGILL